MLNGYKLFHNSTKNIRGVGILVKRNIPFKILNSLKDDHCNILILDMEFGRDRVTIGSLYGPNQNEETFFINLNSFLNRIQTPCLILGGDLNTTWDNRNVNDNLDIHAMINVPSIFRTNKLREICVNHNLTDPYRALYPNRKDFTFIPSAANNLNRSRIDFFLISFPLLEYVKNCTISHGLLSAHFNHKCINLTFKSKGGIKNYPVKNNILNEDEVNWQVTSSVIETYIQHALININYTVVQ
jgi:exonuclease III